MKTSVSKGTIFGIPIWSIKAARNILERWIEKEAKDTWVSKIEYKEENYIIFTNFTVTVWGDAQQVNMIIAFIAQELKEL